MEPTTYLQPIQKVEAKAETEETRSMKRQFPFFGIGSFLYSVFYAFCLYKNASGITYPFFVAGTLYYFFFSMKKLGVPYKKDSIFYIVSIVLLGVSNCMTVSPQILFMNKCGIFLLTLTLMLHTVYNEKEWNLPKYVTAIFHTIFSCCCCLFNPFSDMVSYFDAKKQEESEKKSYFFHVFIGVVIAIPLLSFMTMLLASADAIFSKILFSLVEVLNVLTIVKILFLMTVVFFYSYAVFAALCRKDVKEQTVEKTLFDPVIAIVITALLCVPYLFFSIVQILYLFIGNMELPAGYTYAQYAREGFFQLLAVSIINLVIVLTCLHLFHESKALKGILTVICGCTFIMILSSALRMILYINTYALTFLRLFVLWSLAVIFLLMIQITVSIFYKRFPLFLYGMITLTVCYLALSFSHPDCLIARYDLTRSDNREYLYRLSADAAPILLDPSINPDFDNLEDMLKKSLVDENGNYDADNYYDLYRIRHFYDKVEKSTEAMHLRSFNFSLNRAKKYLP